METYSILLCSLLIAFGVLSSAADDIKDFRKQPLKGLVVDLSPASLDILGGNVTLYFHFPSNFSGFPSSQTLSVLVYDDNTAKRRHIESVVLDRREISVILPCEIFDHPVVYKFKYRVSDSPFEAFISQTLTLTWGEIRLQTPTNHTALTRLKFLWIRHNRKCLPKSRDKLNLYFIKGHEKIFVTRKYIRKLSNGKQRKPDREASWIRMGFPCEVFDAKGIYYFEYQTAFENRTLAKSDSIHVYWAHQTLSTPTSTIFPCTNSFIILYPQPRCRNVRSRDAIVMGDRYAKKPITRNPVQSDHDVAFFACSLFKDYVKEYCFHYVTKSSLTKRTVRVASLCLPSHPPVPESCRELEVDNGGSDSVVLNWKPPVTDAGITKYQITFSGSKSYKENGEFKELSHTRKVKLDAVSPGLQSHTLEGLIPHTTYKIELSAFNSMGEGPKISLTLKTDKGRPPPLQRPVIMENELSDEFVPIELEPASERNGPISYYIVVVVPLRKSNQLPKDKIPDDFFKEVRRRRDTAKRDIDEPYIAAKFSPSELPKIFNVGDKKFKNLYGYYNKELTKGSYYTMFTRAYVKNYKGETLYTSSPFVTPVKFGTSNYDGWSSWSSWGLCSSSCGQGKQHRYRFCTSVSWSMDRASMCAGKALMSRSCALNPCPECTRSNTNITMTTERGVIASPQPKESSHISRCVWRIMAKPEHRLKFTVLFYNISGFVSCSKSEVVVYDGLSSASNVLERFCFTKSNTVRYTRGRHMMVDMSLPKSIYLDFIGTYEVVKMDEGPCPTNKNLSDMSGTLTSPDFPHNYGFEHDCSWIISVPVGYHILLSFDTGDFNIHSCNKSCACDFLEVRAGATSKGKFMGNFCGGIPPSPVYVSGRESLLRFVTNKRTNNKGFRATYKAIRSLADECPRNRTFTDRRGYVHSPMFALDYPGNMECIWRIHVPKEFRVSLVFLAPINLDPNCTDFLEVRDGLDVTSPLLNRYCGSTKAPPTILSSGRAMFVRFKSDSYLRAFDGSSPGFRASYFAIRVKSGAASFLKTSLSLIPLLVFLFNHS